MSSFQAGALTSVKLQNHSCIGSRGLIFALVMVLCSAISRAQSPVPAATASVSGPPIQFINITAVDDQGQPVTDLTSTEFKIFEDGDPKSIMVFNPLLADRTKKSPPPRVLILFDLLNTGFNERENLATLIIRSLQPLEMGDSVYLYLLTNHGDLYNVHDLYKPPQAPSGTENRKTPDVPWTAQIQPLLEQAIQNVNAFRIKDYQDEGVRAATTFMALGEVGDAFMKIPGPKTIIWITHGAPNWVDYPYGCKDVMFAAGGGTYMGGRCGNDCTRRPRVRSCVDYTPFLQHFGTKLIRSDMVVYGVMVRSQNAIPPADRGRPRDTLQQLADLSGGRVYLDGEVDQAVTQSFRDVRSRYQLAYEAPPADGKYHRLRVECSRKGVNVQSPKGYFAERPH
jgi:VWFA-related protein